MKATPGAEVDFGRFHGTKEETARWPKQMSARRAGVGAYVRTVLCVITVAEHRAKPLRPVRGGLRKGRDAGQANGIGLTEVQGIIDCRNDGAVLGGI